MTQRRQARVKTKGQHFEGIPLVSEGDRCPNSCLSSGGCVQSAGLLPLTVIIKRSSESWMTDDDHWVEKYPLYNDNDELIEDMETWAVATTLEVIQRDLYNHLLKLFRLSGKLPAYHITGGGFKVTHETHNLDNRMVVELSFTLAE